MTENSHMKEEKKEKKNSDAMKCRQKIILRTSLQVPQLWSFGSAAVDANVPDAAGISEGVGDFEDLLRQFSGGCQHEDDGSVAALKRRLMLQMDHAGQAEGQRLAGTGLGDSYHVTSCEGGGEERTLVIENTASQPPRSRKYRNNILTNTSEQKAKAKIPS